MRGYVVIASFAHPRWVVALLFISLTAAGNGHSPMSASAPIGGTETSAASSRVNVAAAAEGGTASVSSSHSSGYPGSGANNGDRRGTNWAAGGGWNDATPGVFPDWLQIDFAGAQTIEEIAVFSVQDNYAAPIEPTANQTFTWYGITDFEVQYWTGSAWQAVPGGTITGNRSVWRTVAFSPITTARIRVLVTRSPDGWSRLTEVEAYSVDTPPGGNVAPTVSLTSPVEGATFTAPATLTLVAEASDVDGVVDAVDFYADDVFLARDTSAPYSATWSAVSTGAYTLFARATDDDGATQDSTEVHVTVGTDTGRVNVAAAAQGATASASSSHSSGYPASGANNGDRRGTNWAAGGGWNDATPNSFPDWLQIDFAGAHTIDEIAMFSVQDNYAAPIEPTPSLTFTWYGISDFAVQYWTGSAWQTVPGGAITGNRSVWRTVAFSPITTARIRVLITRSVDGWSRITEVEAYTVDTTPPGGNVAPTVSLTSPVEGATFTAPATLTLVAEASDVDGVVDAVDFYADGAFLARDTSAPYSVSWSGVPAGAYALFARAMDDDGATENSTEVHVTVDADAGRVNLAAAAQGATASASSSHSSGYPAGGANNGDRRGASWAAGGGWNDATPNAFPDWLQIDFAGTRTIEEIAVFSVQDNYAAPIEPTPSLTFTWYGISDFAVQYWTGSAWQTVPGGAITGNRSVWRTIQFSPITTARIRVLVTRSPDGWSRLTEVEAYANAELIRPNPVSSSDLRVTIELAGAMPTSANATSPAVAGSQLLFVDQTGFVYRWDGAGMHSVLTPTSFPSGVSPTGREAVLNVAANATGTSVIVVFTSTTAPAGIPQRPSPKPGANAWHVVYLYDFNGLALSNPRPITALQIRSTGHTGGGLAMLGDGSVLLAIGDNADAGEDGGIYPQDAGNHLGKILHINPATGETSIAALGVRNVQRLVVDEATARLTFVDLGGNIAEELNSVALGSLLDGSRPNFGWGRNADGRAREGTFYISPDGSAVGAAPRPETGFTQPIAQFGRESAGFVGVTGPATSDASFSRITALFADLVSGSAYATTQPLTVAQPVFHVAFEGPGSPVTLAGLAGGRPDPRLFHFADGSAGVLLERTGQFYRLTER